jgi:phosphoribosylanthranilate isomerase
MKIKICGLRRPEDIDMVNQYRPDYIGFIIHFPKSHRNISPEQALALHRRLSPDIPAVGVTVNQPLAFNASLLQDGIVDIIQLHGQESDEDVRALQKQTGKPVWKAFRIRSQADLDAAAASSADLVLLDNGYGTGNAFDWTLLRDIGRPFALAGGLHSENMIDAARMHPYLMDLSSGAETNGVKDEKKIQKLVEIARRIP